MIYKINYTHHLHNLSAQLLVDSFLIKLFACRVGTWVLWLLTIRLIIAWLNYTSANTMFISSKYIKFTCPHAIFFFPKNH